MSSKKIIFTVLSVMLSFCACANDSNFSFPEKMIHEQFDFENPSTKKRFDLADYMRVGDGMALVYAKKKNIDADYCELYMFGSMRQNQYLCYRNGNKWVVLKKELFYNEPYNLEGHTEKQTLFEKQANGVFYDDSSGKKQTASESDAGNINRVVGAASEIISDAAK